VLWEGAEYRGRAREVIWDGSATFAGDSVLDATAINFFNRDKTLDRVGEDGVAWRSLTTGNFAGFDARLADGRKGRLVLDTKLVKADLPLAEIGLEDHLFEADGILPRFVRVFRLPNRNPTRAMRFSRRIRLKAEGDNPLWLRLTQEDGTRAWTSPIYVFR
jgi:hypothetical protein